MTDPHPRTGQAFSSPVPVGSGWPGDPADGPGAPGRTVERVPGVPAPGAVTPRTARPWRAAGGGGVPEITSTD
ncbi:hypothetical protein N869_05890 [Cellulomonas bogoriensis 69B4 = DSM 16987]|uniref:Uncharacterized protein n=1 Tax=Cellulomonas bogoriensis 69B4 = DSM 16987 TaxID=1386082 RepID=A0A0A0BPP0_9CELL|nr:hypothetical protein N869_05890 [Cellulomonas bogoriensis 69B4 = DSM 16987]